MDPILVVDDNEVCRRVAVRQLTYLGLTAQTCVNGKEAMDQLSKASYSLILMDLQMPVMGGIEATKAIRELELSTHQPRIPIIAVTAKPDQQSCLKAGMDDFIFKPVTVDQLRDVLGRWLSPLASMATAGSDIQPLRMIAAVEKLDSDVSKDVQAL